MARFGNKGRFDDRYELKAIYEGMQEELQEFVGQLIPYYRFDREASVVDPIYDVGGAGGGRRFKEPFLLPTLSAGLEEGVEINTGQGQYTTDICHLVVSYDQAEKAGLRKMKTNWRTFLGDRFIYLDTVFQVRNIQVRGPVGTQYEVLGIDGWQVNAEELINDLDFLKYAGPGDPVSFAADLEVLENADPLPEVETNPEVDTALTAAPGAIQEADTDDDGIDDLYGGPAT